MWARLVSAGCLFVWTCLLLWHGGISEAGNVYRPVQLVIEGVCVTERDTHYKAQQNTRFPAHSVTLLARRGSTLSSVLVRLHPFERLRSRLACTRNQNFLGKSQVICSLWGRIQIWQMVVLSTKGVLFGCFWSENIRFPVTEKEALRTRFTTLYVKVKLSRASRSYGLFSFAISGQAFLCWK